MSRSCSAHRCAISSRMLTTLRPESTVHDQRRADPHLDWAVDVPAPSGVLGERARADSRTLRQRTMQPDLVALTPEDEGTIAMCYVTSIERDSAERASGAPAQPRPRPSITPRPGAGPHGNTARMRFGGARYLRR